MSLNNVVQFPFSVRTRTPFLTVGNIRLQAGRASLEDTSPGDPLAPVEYIEMTLTNQFSLAPQSLPDKARRKWVNVVQFYTSPLTAAIVSKDHVRLKKMVHNATKNRKFKHEIPPSEFTKRKVKYKGGKGKHQHMTLYSYSASHIYKLPENLRGAQSLYMVAVSCRYYEGELHFSNVIRETLFQNGKVPVSSGLLEFSEDSFVASAGVVWPGAAHTHKKEWMGGNSHSFHPHPFLKREKIYNTKVIDMRVLPRALMVPRQLEPEPMAEPVPYLSPIELSRNSAGIINGVFSFNISKFIENNSKVAGVIKNPESLLNAVRLEDVIVYAKVTTPALKGNELTPVPKMSCGAGSAAHFVKVASWGDGLDVLDTPNNSSKIIDISFQDSSAVGMLAGFIEYRVEVLLTDRTKQVIERLVEMISASARECQRYLNRPKTLSSSKFATRSAPFGQLVDSYLSLLEYLLTESVFGAMGRAYWRNNLLSYAYMPSLYLDQQRGARSALVMVIENAIKYLTKLISKAPMSTVTATDFNSKIYNSKHDATMRLVRLFDEKFQIQGPPNVGLGYIDNQIGSNTIMPSLTFESYTSRTSQEIEKYNVSNPDATNLNRYGFLSPSFMGIGRSSISTTSLNTPTRQFLPTIRSKQSRNSQVEDQEHAKPEPLNAMEILKSVGVGVETLDVSLKKMVIAPDVVKDKSTAARNYLSGRSTFLFASTGRSELSGSARRSPALVKATRQTKSRAPLTTTLLNRTVAGFKPQVSVKNSANLQGSIALTKARENPGSVALADSMSTVLGFGSVVQVQYLAPYDESVGVKKQNWKTLDPYTFGQSRDNQTSLICRLAPVQNTVAVNKNLESIRPMASLFMLGNPKSKPRDSRTIKDLIDDLRPPDTDEVVLSIREVGDRVIYSKIIPAPYLVSKKDRHRWKAAKQRAADLAERKARKAEEKRRLAEEKAAAARAAAEAAAQRAAEEERQARERRRAQAWARAKKKIDRRTEQRRKEKARKAAEAARKAEEEARKAAEAAEEARKAAEAAEEEKRRQAELQRIKDEAALRRAAQKRKAEVTKELSEVISLISEKSPVPTYWYQLPGHEGNRQRIPSAVKYAIHGEINELKDRKVELEAELEGFEDNDGSTKKERREARKQRKSQRY